ncbi:P-loop containing nucleoside triphosphate hydrolase protein [Trichoderma ceciliae]
MESDTEGSEHEYRRSRKYNLQAKVTYHVKGPSSARVSGQADSQIDPDASEKGWSTDEEATQMNLDATETDSNDLPIGARLETVQSSKKREKIIMVDQIWDASSQESRFADITEVVEPRQKDQGSRYVITITRRLSKDGAFHGNIEIQIRGQHIRDVLVSRYRDVDSISFGEVISLKNKYQICWLYFAIAAIKNKWDEETKLQDPNEEALFELESVMEFAAEYFRETVTRIKKLPELQIEFSILWTLFPPHCLLYSKGPLGQGQVYRLKKASYEQLDPGKPRYFLLSTDYIDSDGERIGYTVRSDFKIFHFDGYMPFRNLPLFPLQLHEQYPDIAEELVARGEKKLRLNNRHIQEYEGHALDKNRKKFNSHGRVVIDPVRFYHVQPENEILPVICSPIDTESLSLEQKILLNPLLYGFSLEDKQWGAFAISRLQDVAWDDNLLNTLALEPERKGFIRSLTRRHVIASEGIACDDLVRDKGKGLIGLLAGPPGVGKGSMAKAIAETAHRPLYIINSGELGDTPSLLQKRLKKALELVETWNAALLVYEADIFLAKRDIRNLAQNAVTSIFLQFLEQYQGILILTINRHEDVDEVFQRHIQFYIKHEDLDVSSRLLIWCESLRRTKESTGIEVLLQEADMRQLSALELNGRQIKNVVDTSQAVAAEENRPMTLEGVLLAIKFTQMSWNVERRSMSIRTNRSSLDTKNGLVGREGIRKKARMMLKRISSAFDKKSFAIQNS